MSGILEEVRSGAAYVAEHAELVRVDRTRLEAFARSLLPRLRGGVRLDPGYFYQGDPATTLAYVVTFNSVNFGSGWWPHVVKLPGQSGSTTMMRRLSDRFCSVGPLSATELTTMTVADCAGVFGQPLRHPVDELMKLFTRALQDLGELLLDRYGGSFEALVENAGGKAERLVELLLAMPMHRDIASYRGRDVPILKRAQLTAADLTLALGGAGLGRFDDLDRLTVFADNLLPHVLRMEGVLVYDIELLRSIEAGALIPAGAQAEVEMRAVTIDAVAQMVALLAAGGATSAEYEIDYVLWQAGHSPRYKSELRHRTRTVYY